MRISHIRPCPFCAGPARHRQLPGGQSYTHTACPRCGSFLLEPTLPPNPWEGLEPAEALLVAFLPVFIRHQNRRRREPLLTQGNWRALARRGCMVAVREAALMRTPCGGRPGTRGRAQRW